MKKVFLGITTALVLFFAYAVGAPAQAQQSGFSVQVSPSPIYETIQPGTSKTIELKIRNTAAQTEQLKMGMRSFTVESTTREVKLQDDPPKDVIGWVNFENPVFTVAAGEWFTQRIQLAPPADVGFAYSFAITVSRANPQTNTDGKAAIEGSVAVFTLLNVERADATRKLETVTFSSKNKLYEYLPATLTLRLKNSGNTIVRPGGNIYIQRAENSTQPISVLPVNESGAYFLPSTEREVTVKWEDGFPVYKTTDQGTKLVWDWGDLQKLRIGKYTAKAIVVYNDGQRDIPIETAVSFWVFPWKIALVSLVFLTLLIVGVVTIIKKVVVKVRTSKNKHETPAA